jgi:hypothetical protein
VIARVENFLICKAAFEKALCFGQNVAIECCFAAIVSGATEEERQCAKLQSQPYWLHSE